MRLASPVLDAQEGHSAKSEGQPREDIAEERDAEYASFDDGHSHMTMNRVEILDLISPAGYEGEADPSDKDEDRPVTCWSQSQLSSGSDLRRGKLT